MDLQLDSNSFLNGLVVIVSCGLFACDSITKLADDVLGPPASASAASSAPPPMQAAPAEDKSASIGDSQAATPSASMGGGAPAAGAAAKPSAGETAVATNAANKAEESSKKAEDSSKKAEEDKASQDKKAEEKTEADKKTDETKKAEENKTPEGKISIGSVQNTGMDGANVNSVVKGTLPGMLDKCYASALRRTPDSAGQVNVALRIDKEGKVEDLITSGGDGLTGGVMRCVKGRGRRLKFKAPEKGSGSVSFPVTFSIK